MTDARLRVLFRRLRRECELQTQGKDDEGIAATEAGDDKDAHVPGTPSVSGADTYDEQRKTIGVDYNSACKIIIQVQEL